MNTVLFSDNFSTLQHHYILPMLTVLGLGPIPSHPNLRRPSCRHTGYIERRYDKLETMDSFGIFRMQYSKHSKLLLPL